MCELDFDSLPQKTLIKPLKLHFRLFLIIDSLLFLALKKKCGYNVALEMDIKAWEGHFPYEAKNVKETMVIEYTSANGVLNDLRYSASVPYGRHVIPKASEDREAFIFYDYPSLSAMERTGYATTCEPVGGAHAKVINPEARICFLDGPPHKSLRDIACKWEITVEENA